MKPQILGKIGQDIAEKYFRNRGYRVTCKNWHSRYGEIDLILEKEHGKFCRANSIHDQPALIFCEVKTRMMDQLSDGRFMDGRFGSGEEALDFRKKSRILKTVFVYLEWMNDRNGNHENGKNKSGVRFPASWRIDLVCIKFEKGADGKRPRVSLNHYENI